jgi:hypothetical protein
MKPQLRVPAAVAIAALLVAACAFFQQTREARYPISQDAEESLYITSGKTLTRLTRGYNAIAADLYWIRTIQYYGGLKRAIAGSDPHAAAAADYRLLYPLLDVTTTLDRRFNIAYRFGAIFLAEAPPGGPGRPDMAIALLQKGLNEQPDKWEYMQDIGFVHYWWRHDYKAAAAWFNRAGNTPGGPWWLKSLAASTLAEGGDRRASRLMWEQLRQSAEVDWLRRDAERRLAQLRALDDIDALQAIVNRYGVATGGAPAGWEPIVGAGLLRGTPLDPAQTPYEIDGAGRVRVSMKSPLFPLPEEPQRLQPAS